MKLSRNLPDFAFPKEWLSMLEADWLNNFRKIEYGSTEDYDHETSNLVMTPDGKGLGREP